MHHKTITLSIFIIANCLSLSASDSDTEEIDSDTYEDNQHNLIQHLQHENHTLRENNQNLRGHNIILASRLQAEITQRTDLSDTNRLLTTELEEARRAIDYKERFIKFIEKKRADLEELYKENYDARFACLRKITIIEGSLKDAQILHQRDLEELSNIHQNVLQQLSDDTQRQSLHQLSQSLQQRLEFITQRNNQLRNP